VLRRLVDIMQRQLATNVSNAFGVLGACNREEEVQQRLVKPFLILSAKARSRESRLLRKAY
jgi:hypothetical protein